MTRAALIFAALALMGCVDRPPSTERCEVWVDDYTRRKSYCVSRTRVIHDVLKPMTGELP